MITIKKVGQWERAAEALSQQTIRRFGKAQQKAIAREAKQAKKILISELRKRAPGGQRLDRLSRSTLAVRRHLGITGTRPLIATGEFLRAISLLRADDSTYFIGVPKSAKDKRGKSIAKVIDFQERGGTVTIKLTPKLLAFLRRSGMKRKRSRRGASSGRKVLIVRIKPRPVFEPAFDAYVKDSGAAKKRVAADIAKQLGGRYGYPG